MQKMYIKEIIWPVDIFQFCTKYYYSTKKHFDFIELLMKTATG